MAAVLASTDAAETSTRPAVLAEGGAARGRLTVPRTRYPVGRGAAAIMVLRRVLPDRPFDAAVVAVLKRVAR
jgi:hypothetical protein